MKRIFLALFLFLILLIQPLPGAITKTTTITIIDDWQAVAPATLVVGNPHNISGSYQTKVHLEIPYTDPENSAQAGVEYIVEISYADDNWVQLIRRTTIGDATASTTINDGAVTAGDTTITLTDATTGDFDVPARKWFILDGTVANSESVKTVVNSTHTVTLAQDLLRNHANGLTVYDFVFEKVISIPMPAAYVRVLINNTDADATIHFTTRVSKVTEI